MAPAAVVVVAAVTGRVKLAQLPERAEEQMELREVLARVVVEGVAHRLLAARAEANLARLEGLAAMAQQTSAETAVTMAAAAAAAANMAEAAEEGMMTVRVAAVAVLVLEIP